MSFDWQVNLFPEYLLQNEVFQYMCRKAWQPDRIFLGTLAAAALGIPHNIFKITWGTSMYVYIHVCMYIYTFSASHNIQKCYNNLSFLKYQVVTIYCVMF